MAFQLQEGGWRMLLIWESIGAGDWDTCVGGVGLNLHHVY